MYRYEYIIRIFFPWFDSLNLNFRDSLNGFWFPFGGDWRNHNTPFLSHKTLGFARQSWNPFDQDSIVSSRRIGSRLDQYRYIIWWPHKPTVEWVLVYSTLSICPQKQGSHRPLNVSWALWAKTAPLRWTVTPIDIPIVQYDKTLRRCDNN